MPSVSIPVNRSFPLKKIFLRNFKSVKDAEVPISPLTVVVGANSSGKSTLLQSILSISQAISKDLNGTIYPLNGERIRLGTFAETRSFSARDTDVPIQIGFGIESEFNSYRNAQTSRVRQSMQTERIRFRYQAQLIFDLMKSGSDENGTAQICKISVDSERRDDSNPLVPIHQSKMELSFDPDRPSQDQRRSDSFIECSGNVYDSETKKVLPVSGSSFVGLIPSALWEMGDNAIFNAETIIGTVEKGLAAELASERVKTKQRPVSDQVRTEIEDSAIEIACEIFANLVDNYFPDQDEDAAENGMPVYTHQDGDLDFYNEMQKLNPEQKKKLAALVANSNIDQIAKALDRTTGYPFVVGGVAARHVRGESNHIANDLSTLAKQIFRHKITYMGPIRLTPKVNYDPSSGRPDVGSSGEFTAYVLHALGHQNFLFPLPNGTREYVSLNEAVNLWLESFGLASSAKTADNGRLGIGLRLNLLSGGNEVDLTSVGVGVSQVLPVLISCLIAKKGTVLLLEQPELHLHPKLQMDLADFLIACCKSGRQIIVETHSEHMVSRIRRRIAESNDSELEDLVGILFAEQKNGVTKYRSPSINKFGGLGSDWPDGFLDVGAAEMENLLGAGLAKRKKS